jgi:type II secretory pathway component GspD/PulD (secretin)
MRYIPMFLVAAAILIVVKTGRCQERAAAGRPVAVEVLFADVSAAAAGEGELTAAKIVELAAQGKLESAMKIKLSLIENQQGSIQFGETVPLVTGRQTVPEGFPGGRGGGSTYSMQNLGTTVEATSRIEQDGTIAVQLSAEQSRLPKPRPPAEGDAPPAIESRRIAQTTARTTVRVTSGKPEIVGGQATTSADSSVHSYIVLTATVPEGAKAAAAPESMLKMFALRNAQAADLVLVIRTVLRNEPLTVAVDERSNSLVINGPPDSLSIVEALLVRLDAP